MEILLKGDRFEWRLFKLCRWLISEEKEIFAMARFRSLTVLSLIIALTFFSGCGSNKEGNVPGGVIKHAPESQTGKCLSGKPSVSGKILSSDHTDGADLAEVLSERRAAFDIGSGSIKLKVKDVVFEMDNTLYRKVINGDYHRRVDFEDSLSHSSGGVIPPDVVDEGVNALKELKTIAIELGATRFCGVATGAFRKAANRDLVLQKFSEAVGIIFTIVSSDEEAALAFQAAEVFSEFDPENLVVWDIGASTMSISGMTLEGDLETYGGSLASTRLRNDVIRSIQGMGKNVKTPNPLNKRDADIAVLLVQSEAQSSVPRSLVERIGMEDTVVAGVGPVHSLSVKPQFLKNEVYSVRAVENALSRNLNLSDEEIGGNFADTDVINLILVLGFMKGLNITEVKLVDVNIADGLIHNENYWR
jgi:exopolyphosphatase/guanosine-5'-triphosphate,3'-diphosphate pyrophosphatase